MGEINVVDAIKQPKHNVYRSRSIKLFDTNKQLDNKRYNYGMLAWAGQTRGTAGAVVNRARSLSPWQILQVARQT